MLETKTKKLMKQPHRQSEASEKRKMTDVESVKVTGHRQAT